MENSNTKVVDGVAYMPQIKRYLYVYNYYSDSGKLVLTDRNKILYMNQNYLFVKRSTEYTGVFGVDKKIVYNNIEEVVKRLYYFTSRDYNFHVNKEMYTSFDIAPNNDPSEAIYIKDLLSNARDMKLTGAINNKIDNIDNMISMAKDLLNNIDKERSELFELVNNKSIDVLDGIDNDTENTIDYLSKMLSKLEEETWEAIKR